MRFVAQGHARPILVDDEHESATPDDYEICPFCGLAVETPCDLPPADTCEMALDAIVRGGP